VIGFLFGLLDPGRPLRNLTLSFFNKGRKFDCPYIRNFDVWRGASNPHGCDGSVDLHVASLRYLASNKVPRNANTPKGSADFLTRSAEPGESSVRTARSDAGPNETMPQAMASTPYLRESSDAPVRASTRLISLARARIVSPTMIVGGTLFFLALAAPGWKNR